MPKKKNPDITPAMKAIAAYWLLLFTGRAWSLPDLARELDCSKQTVMRIMDDISLSRYAKLHDWIGNDRKKYYQLDAPKDRPAPAFTSEDIQTLLLCRDMAWNLLPDSLRETVSRAIGHTTVLLPDFDKRKSISGVMEASPQPRIGVDYREKGEVMNCLVKARDDHRVCELEYRAAYADTPRVHRVVPCLLYRVKDSLYLEGWLLREDGDAHQTTMTVQRIIQATMTEEVYDKPWPNDKSAGFGIIKDDPFTVKASFTRSAACYVSERTWSEDQKIQNQEDGGVILEFTATSWPEVISWALSFGTEITVLEPEELREEIGHIAQNLVDKYSIK
jgi:predicted DNA-binding transcriptional regulator YafY